METLSIENITDKLPKTCYVCTEEISYYEDFKKMNGISEDGSEINLYICITCSD